MGLGRPHWGGPPVRAVLSAAATPPYLRGGVPIPQKSAQLRKVRSICPISPFAPASVADLLAVPQGFGPCPLGLPLQVRVRKSVG
jgi:hypothetical protein